MAEVAKNLCAEILRTIVDRLRFKLKFQSDWNFRATRPLRIAKGLEGCSFATPPAPPGSSPSPGSGQASRPLRGASGRRAAGLLKQALRALSMKTTESARGSSDLGHDVAARLVAGAASRRPDLQVWRTPLVAGVYNRSKPDYGPALPKTARLLLTWSAVTPGAAAPQLLRI
jgi:hypothetical protein